MEDDGADYGYDEVHSRQWIAGGRPELDFELVESWSGHEDGIASEMGSTRRHFVGWADSRPVVYGSAQVLRFHYDGEWFDCDCATDNEYTERGDCCDMRDIAEVNGWSLAAAGSGQIRVTRVEGTEAPETQTLSIVDLQCPTRAQPAAP